MAGEKIRKNWAVALSVQCWLGSHFIGHIKSQSTHYFLRVDKEVLPCTLRKRRIWDHCDHQQCLPYLTSLSLLSFLFPCLLHLLSVLLPIFPSFPPPLPFSLLLPLHLPLFLCPDAIDMNAAYMSICMCGSVGVTELSGLGWWTKSFSVFRIYGKWKNATKQNKCIVMGIIQIIILKISRVLARKVIWNAMPK